jgi:hypothetical protein
MEKASFGCQVWLEEMNESESPMTCRYMKIWESKPRSFVALENAWRVSAYQPSDPRYGGGMNSSLALLWNHRNLFCSRGLSRNRDGQSRSSIENFVMKLERRGLLIWSCLVTNCVCRRSER